MGYNGMRWEVQDMNRVTVAEAGRDFAGLVNRVCAEGVGVELQQGDNVIAYLTPATPQSPLKATDLNSFIAGLPKLGDDADAFSADVPHDMRCFMIERRTQVLDGRNNGFRH